MQNQIIETKYQGQYKDTVLANLSEFWINIGNEYDTWDEARDKGVYLCDRLIAAFPELALSFRVLKTQTIVSLEMEYNPEDRGRKWEYVE